MFNFTHALRHTETGGYYTGEAGDHWVAPPSLNHPPYTYTEKGAESKLATFQSMGFNFTIVRCDLIRYNLKG